MTAAGVETYNTYSRIDENAQFFVPTVGTVKLVVISFGRYISIKVMTDIKVGIPVANRKYHLNFL